MSRFITYLMLDRPAAVSVKKVINAFRELTPGTPLTIESPGSASDAAEPAFIVMVNKRPMSVMFVDKPLPAESWEGAAARCFTWREAAEVVRRTQAHVIIALLEPTTGHNGAFLGAAAVTTMAAALAHWLPAAAMVFTEAESIIPAGTIAQTAVDIWRTKPPVLLWTSVAFAPSPPLPDGRATASALTIGLRPFIGRELEFQPAPLQPTEIAARLLTLCEYLLTKGPVIKDGETVGLSEREKIRVRYAAAGRRPGVPVMLLSLETTDPAVQQSFGTMGRTVGKGFGKSGP